MDEIRDLYSRHAARYDRLRSRDLMERPYLDMALERMPAHSRILDLGCGAGEPIARYFVDRGHVIVGVDIALPMIELCRSRFPPMMWIVGDMRGMGLRRRFDLIVAWDSVFHLSAVEQREMFSTFERHAASRGLLLFTSGARAGVALGELGGSELYHASLSTEEYHELLARHGFRVVVHRSEDPACGGHTVWLAERCDSRAGAHASASTPQPQP